MKVGNNFYITFFIYFILNFNKTVFNLSCYFDLYILCNYFILKKCVYFLENKFGTKFLIFYMSEIIKYFLLIKILLVDGFDDSRLGTGCYRLLYTFYCWVVLWIRLEKFEWSFNKKFRLCVPLYSLYISISLREFREAPLPQGLQVVFTVGRV